MHFQTRLPGGVPPTRSICPPFCLSHGRALTPVLPVPALPPPPSTALPFPSQAQSPPPTPPLQAPPLSSYTCAPLSVCLSVCHQKPPLTASSLSTDSVSGLPCPDRIPEGAVSPHSLHPSLPRPPPPPAFPHPRMEGPGYLHKRVAKSGFLCENCVSFCSTPAQIESRLVFRLWTDFMYLGQFCSGHSICLPRGYLHPRQSVRSSVMSLLPLRSSGRHHLPWLLCAPPGVFLFGSWPPASLCHLCRPSTC